MGGSGLGGGAATVKVKPGQEPNQALDANLKMQNTSNPFGQVERLQQRLNPTANPQSQASGRGRIPLNEPGASRSLCGPREAGI